MLENKEVWKDIKGYEGYQISNYGRVWSAKSQRILKGGINNSGYHFVQMKAKNGKFKREYIHRLVAMAFIPNPDNLPQVNHKDEDKANNNVENLEWCTHKYNQNYGTKIERQVKNRTYAKLGQHSQAREVLCIELGIVFNCAKSATIKLGIDNSDIGKACRGKLKTAGGYHWRYVNGDNDIEYK